MEYQNVLCWVRRDLRLTDHTALREATLRSPSVTVVFIFDTKILTDLADSDDRRLTFIADSLTELAHNLNEYGSALIVRHGDPVEEIPRLAHQLGAQAIFTNEDYEGYAKRRDQAVEKALANQGVRFHAFTDQVVFAGGAFQNQSGEAYRVFTPYKNAWLKKLALGDLLDRTPRLEHLVPRQEIAPFAWEWNLEKVGFQRSALWLEAGERAAHTRLELFQKHLSLYAEQRDFPAKPGTSGLSAHLRFGTVSIRACLRSCTGQLGAETWRSELIWREFYQMILDRFPHVEETAFRPEYQNLPWPGTEEDFAAWRDGRTGFPLIDAAMRAFRKTGWMHNRLRMVVASFLVKDLLCDWRWGERYFARYLLDYELASNNGGWQWCASTGCDAQPYFRIFNPVTQSKRFDPDGTYIRSELPELDALPIKALHEPAVHSKELERCGLRLGRDYPKPIVDHDEQRFKVLALFSAHKKAKLK